jgi:hypothetical protein
MQADALVGLGDRVILGDAAFADDARDGLCLRHALLLHQELEGAIASPAGRHLEHAVSLPSASRNARTLRLCSKVRCAMLSASCSIETQALTRRTFDWLSTGLLKRMSRERDNVIF